MKHKKILKRVVIGLLAFLIVGGTGAAALTGYFLFSNITQLSTNEATGTENSLEGFKAVGFDYTDFQQQYKIEPVNITSTLDGHIIPADFITSSASPNGDTVVMVHGISGNHQSIFPIAATFLENGYNVLAFDQRSAGQNTAKYTTFGYLESFDVADCVSYLDGILDAKHKIFIWGISNGAATAGISVRHQVVENRVTSVILDCPFSSTEDMLRIKLNRMNLPVPVDFMIFCGDIYNRAILGFSFADASATRYIAQSNLPILIIASKADDFTQYWMAEKLASAAPNCQLAFVDDSSHAEIFFDHPDWYSNTINEFMKRSCALLLSAAAP